MIRDLHTVIVKQEKLSFSVAVTRMLHVFQCSPNHSLVFLNIRLTITLRRMEDVKQSLTSEERRFDFRRAFRGSPVTRRKCLQSNIEKM